MINYSIVPPLFVRVSDWEIFESSFDHIHLGYFDVIYDDDGRSGQRSNPYWMVRYHFDVSGVSKVDHDVGYWISDNFNYYPPDPKGSLEYVFDDEDGNQNVLYTAPYIRSELPRKV